MSIANVKAFFERVQSDPGLRAKLKAYRADGPISSTVHMQRIATAAGLPFTLDEYEAATMTHQGPPAPRRR